MKVRQVSLYVVFPKELMDTPIPLTRLKVPMINPKTGEPYKTKKTFLTARQVWPDAKPLPDGSVIVGFDPVDFAGELAELQKFPDYDKLKVLSHTQAKQYISRFEKEGEGK